MNSIYKILLISLPILILKFSKSNKNDEYKPDFKFTSSNRLNLDKRFTKKSEKDLMMEKIFLILKKSYPILIVQNEDFKKKFLSLD